MGPRLGQRFALVNDAAPNNLRIRLTLAGAATTPVLSTVMRFDIGGGLYNGVQAARGGEGLFTGSASYAVEIFDVASNTLLDAFVAKQDPNAYNIPAGIGSLAAARTGSTRGRRSFWNSCADDPGGWGARTSRPPSLSPAAPAPPHPRPGRQPGRKWLSRCHQPGR